LQPAGDSISAPARGSKMPTRRNAGERILKRNGAKARSSGGFLDFAVADAGGANLDMLARAIDQSADCSQVGIPTTPTRIVRVADHVTERGRLPAQLTLRHLC
jgi:hypothetical protein